MTFPAMAAVPTNYFAALAMAMAIAALLIVPGLGFNAARHGRGGGLRSALVPLPGFAMLALAGLALWVGRGTGTRVVVASVLAVAVAAALTLAWGCWRRRRIVPFFGEQGLAPFALWFCVVGSATAIGINPLPMAQEYPAGDTLPARMVASPPDNTIPYLTAAYMLHGKDGKERSDDYFGEGWSIGSRGPLVPLAIAALLRVFDDKPSDPPLTERTRWPVTREGAFVARLFGWLTNGMVVLGVGHLLSVLRGRGPAWRAGLAWAALAPVTLINTVFLWPKLLAAFFVLLSSASILEGGFAVAGLWAALAWLSHPVGALFLPGLGGLLLWGACRPAPRPGRVGAMTAAAMRFGLVLAVAMAPWQAYKLWLGQHDPFLDYLLAAGDTARAQRLEAWLSLRVGNAGATLVPGLFFYEGHMAGWVYGPLSDAMRWTVQYAKTLPSELGFSLFWAAYAAILFPTRDRRLRALNLFGVAIGFLVMLVFWGYSADGLGRNCLEPLTYLMIVSGVSVLRLAPVVWALGLLGVFIEGRWIEVSGFVGADGFAWSHVPAAAFAACGVSSALQGAVAAWMWRGRRRDGAVPS